MIRKERIRDRGKAENIIEANNRQNERCRVLLTVIPDQLDLCVIGKNDEFLTFSLIMF